MRYIKLNVYILILFFSFNIIYVLLCFFNCSFLEDGFYSILLFLLVCVFMKLVCLYCEVEFLNKLQKKSAQKNHVQTNPTTPSFLTLVKLARRAL